MVYCSLYVHQRTYGKQQMPVPLKLSLLVIYLPFITSWAFSVGSSTYDPGTTQSNVQFIDFINSLDLTFKLSDNEFADLTNEEFKTKYLGLNTSSVEIPETQVSVFSDAAGGNLPFLYRWLLGILGSGSTETSYPYKAKDATCDKTKLRNHVVTISGYSKVKANDEMSLQAAAARQPISVAIDAGGYAFQLYSSGVFTGYCGKELNHGVTLVGYGEASGHKYWIVKNSWGTSWGEKGYIRMARNTKEKTGICGIAMMASYPIK